MVHLASGIRRIGDKDPIDGAPVRQDVRSRGWPSGQSHGVAKTGVAQNSRGIAGARIEVEIAGDYHCRLVHIPAEVRKDLVQLAKAKVVGASTLQVKVVAHYLAAVDRRFGDEGDPPADPALKNG